MGKTKSIYRFNHHDFSDATILLVNQKENIIQQLHKAVKAMDSKSTIQHNKLIQLENLTCMCGIYNTETLEKLINRVNHIHNTTSSHERLFAGQQSSLTL